MLTRKNIYLACPYRAATPEELEARMSLFSEAVRQIRNQGHFVTSPVMHHLTFIGTEEANDADYWFDYSEDLLVSLREGSRYETEMWILTLDGHDASSGVKLERKVAKNIGIRVITVNFNHNNELVEVPDLWCL